MSCSPESDSLAAGNQLLEGKNVVRKSGAVATDPAQAARAGASILANSDNAMDAPDDTAGYCHRFADGSAITSQILRALCLTVCTREPLEFIEFEFTQDIPQHIVDGLTSMGHTVGRKHGQVEGAGATHCVEVIKPENSVCASGNTWAAGVG